MLIHSQIYKETAAKRQFNGKICKIIECLPYTEGSSDTQIPDVYNHYVKYKTERLNNEYNQEKNYQCLYCPFMNTSKNIVIEHCVHKHPDYHILYYKPSEITSTQTNQQPLSRQISEFGK